MKKTGHVHEDNQIPLPNVRHVPPAEHRGSGDTCGPDREVLVDNVPAGLADDYEDVLDPTDDGGRCEYLILKGGRGTQLLVSIPGFSSRTITIKGPLATGKPWVPLVIAVNVVNCCGPPPGLPAEA
ncbi:MAG: hypothetical protein QXR87_06490 [Candidatus Hadarchaeales archaeon]